MKLQMPKWKIIKLILVALYDIDKGAGRASEKLRMIQKPRRQPALCRALSHVVDAAQKHLDDAVIREPIMIMKMMIEYDHEDDYDD